MTYEIQEYVRKIRHVASTPEQAEAALQRAQNMAETNPTLMVTALQAAYEDLIADTLRIETP